MKTQDAITLAGGTPKRLAAMLDITPSAISQWGDDVPTSRYWQWRVTRPEWFNEDGSVSRKALAHAIEQNKATEQGA